MAAPEEVNFPFRVARNSPWTAVHISGKDPGLPFLLDTGSTGFGILDAKARELGLARWGKALSQAGVGRVNINLYSASLLVGGSVRHDDVMLGGIARDLRGGLQGLIPMTRFNAMGFDFDTSEITVSRHLPKTLEGYMPLDLDKGDGDQGSLDRLGAFTTSQEYQSFRDHRPVIDAEFDGQPVKLLVDTGATSGLFLFPDYVKSRGLWDHYPKAMPTMIETLAGASKARLVRAERLKIARIAFVNPIVCLGDPQDFDRDGTKAADGVIGMEFLRRLNFVNDPKRWRIWIKPNRAISDGYRIDRTGAHVELVNGEGRVTALSPGSPAARAGLRMDDKITGWRGRDGIEGLAWAMLGAPGSKIDIQVERDGKPQMIAVTLEEPF